MVTLGTIVIIGIVGTLVTMVILETKVVINRCRSYFECLFIVSSFTQNLNVSTDCSNNPQYKFHTNLWWNQIVPYKWTDRHGKASSHFSQLFNGGLKIDDMGHEWKLILSIFLWSMKLGLVPYSTYHPAYH